MGEWNQTLAQVAPGTMPDEEADVTPSDLKFDSIEAAVMETTRGLLKAEDLRYALLNALG